MKRLKHLIPAVLVTLLSGSCRNDLVDATALTKVRLSPLLQPLLLVGDDAPTKLLQPRLWRRDGISLVVPSETAWRQLALLDDKLELVMVSLPRDATLSRELAADPRVLAFLPSPDGLTVHALLAGKDQLLLDALAGSAHVASGHTCGNIERLNLRALVDDGAFTPAVYSESVHLEDVAALTSSPTAANISATIKALEAMGTRYYTSTSGKAAPAEIKNLFEAAAGGKIAGLKVELVAVSGIDQPNVVVTIPGASDAGTTVAIGAHLDSINSGGATLPAPGADDDASGIATLVEIVRVIADSGAHFERTIELHGYAAEEVGLRGSQALAWAYRDAGKKLSAIMQIDMNSWAADGADTIYLVTNDTSSTLRRSVKDLMNNYLGGGFIEKRLASGTSDHRSWTNAGFQAVFPFEDPANYNEALHSSADTSTTINNLPLAARFAKLGLVFLGHHAGLSSAKASYDNAKLTQALPKDLKLAVVATPDADTYDVSVAAPTSVSRVELCQVDAAGTYLCNAERIETNAARTTGGRAFFGAARTMTVADGSRLAVFGYDANDKLIEQRSVRLKAK